MKLTKKNKIFSLQGILPFLGCNCSLGKVPSAVPSAASSSPSCGLFLGWQELNISHRLPIQPEGHSPYCRTKYNYKINNFVRCLKDCSRFIVYKLIKRFYNYCQSCRKTVKINNSCINSYFSIDKTFFYFCLNNNNIKISLIQ